MKRRERRLGDNIWETSWETEETVENTEGDKAPTCPEPCAYMPDEGEVAIPLHHPKCGFHHQK
jgi:hypothetical protein